MRVPWMVSLAVFLLCPQWGVSQSSLLMRGEGIPVELEEMYQNGLKYLASSQDGSGNWRDGGAQPGIAGIAVLAFLAHGEDGNYGPYRDTIRKGLSYIISQQTETGMIGGTMYNHGFATLALAEAYGQVDVPDLATAFQKAIEMIIKSQAQNPKNAWRYQGFGKDADTTVSGAQMVALYAAKNAGLPVPDEAIDRGLAYFHSCMDTSGGIGYTSRGGGNATRSAIASLCFSLNKDRDSDGAKKTFEYIRKNQNQQSSYVYYHMYYMAQALFHGDMNQWRTWNRKSILLFKATQQDDGSWQSSHGAAFGTGSALLAMALNYRLMPIYER